MQSNRIFHPEVTQAIEAYFLEANINQAMAARLLGVTPQAVSLQLKQPFGKNVSRKWARTFGFDSSFLMTGEGTLRKDPSFTHQEMSIYDEAQQTIKGIKAIEVEEKQLSSSEDNVNVSAEDQYYRNLDINSLIEKYKWETEQDYNNALEILEVLRVNISDLSAEIEYYDREKKKLAEENKKLFIENIALRRQVKERQPKTEI